MNMLNRFFFDESGSEMVEYALVMSVVTIASVVGVQLIGSLAFGDEQSNAARLQNTGVAVP